MVKKVLFAGLFGTLVLFGLVFSQMAGEGSADPSAQLEQAETYMEDGNYEQAEAIYQTIITDYPGSDDAFKAQEKLTILYVLWGKQAEADAAYQDLLANFSENEGIAKAVDHVADAYREVEEYEKALQLYRYVVDTWPDDEHAIWSQKSIVLTNILLGDDEAAQAAMDTLLTDFSDNPNIAVAIDSIADDYSKLKEYEKARELYQYVVETWPDANQAMWSQEGVACTSILLGDEETAEAALDKLVGDFSWNEDIAKAVDHVADQYGELEKYERARELYQYVVDTWPQAEHAIESQAAIVRLNIALGDETAAEEAIDTLVADFGGDERIVRVLNNIADVYLSSQKYEKATLLFQYVLENWPQDEHTIWSQMELTKVNIALGDANAQADINKLVADFSEHSGLPEALYEIAGAHEKAKNYEQAANIHQQIIQQHPHSPEAEKAQVDAAKTNILSLIQSADDEAADAATDNLMADFTDHSDLPAAVFRIGLEYYLTAFERGSVGPPDEARYYFRKATAILETVINELPGSDATPEACCAAGDCYRKLGKYEKSLECYQKIVDDWPDYKYAWHALFLVARNYEDLKKSGRISKSEADLEIKATFEQLVEKYPNCKVAKSARHWLRRHKSL